MNDKHTASPRSAAQIDAIDRNFLGHPKPLRSLFFTEMWERFSYYGIRPLLILFMAATLYDGGLGFSKEVSSQIVGIFGGALYLAAVPGGWLADNWLGQKKAVWYGSVIIALGHLAIALSYFFNAAAFFIGLALIVVGSGLFKTCISVLVGALYQDGDGRRDGGFSIFYMGINIGSLLAPFITGILTKEYGWHLGFGIGGIGMLFALLVFRFSAIGRLREFADAKNITADWEAPVKQRKNVGRWVLGLCALAVIVVILMAQGMIVLNPSAIATAMTYVICGFVGMYFIYLFAFCGLNRLERAKLIVCLILLCAAALFWSAFEQQPTSFNLFALDYTDRHILGWEIPTVWFQSANPLFILLFAPFFGFLWPYLAKRKIEPSSLAKFALGLLLASAGFAIMIFAAQSVLSGSSQMVSPLWLIASYLLLTLGELCLSPVGLSTMTKLAPTMMRGQIMGLWYTASALGNLVAGLIGGHVSAERLDNLPSLFAQCALALFIGAIVLIILIKPVKAMLATQAKYSA
ncbi:MAG: peptide MFS transporter [Neisseriaceae bacterium]|nr:peptide MFS transporter [Neisseriaceae bacterium]